MAKALYRYGATRQIDYTPGAAKVAGDLVKLSDNRPAVVVAAVAANKLGAVYVDGVFDVDSATGTTISAGGECYADVSDSDNAIPTASKATGDYLLGVALAAKTSGQLVMTVDLGAKLGTVSA